MKLLFIASQLSPTNGWGKVAFETIRRFARDEHRVTVLTDDPARPDLGSANVIRTNALLSKCGGMSRHIRVFRDYIKNRERIDAPFDVVFCLTEDLLPLASRYRTQTRYLGCLAHGTYAIKTLQGGTRRIYSSALGKCDFVLCNSSYTQRQLNRVSNARFAAKTEVVRLGCTATLSEADYRRSVEDRSDLIIAVGQLKRRKAILESIRAFADFRRRFPQFEFHVIGDQRLADYVSEVQNLIEQLDVGGAVKLVGQVSEAELQEYYLRSKLLLMPSITENDHFEGFGLVHLEANVWGTPTVGSTGCGHEEAIKDGFSGRLTPQRDVTAIRDAMTEILQTEQTWRRYSRNAFEFSQTMSWEHFYQHLCNSFSKLETG